MPNNIMTITLDSCASTSTNAFAFAVHCKAHYNIKAIFHDGGDHYSSWTLTGLKADLKRLINDEWNPSPSAKLNLQDIRGIMAPTEFAKLYDDDED